jgi:hypothetical protein
VLIALKQNPQLLDQSFDHWRDIYVVGDADVDTQVHAKSLAELRTTFLLTPHKTPEKRYEWCCG